MWKKIETNETVIKLQKGNKVSQNPADPLFDFETRVIQNGYISMVNSNNHGSVGLFPLDMPVKDNWWMKK
jgi:hypothetical protein